MTAAALIATLANSAAFAQTIDALTPAKPIKTVVVHPDGTTAPRSPAPAGSANALASTERQAIQSDLAWIGAYNGTINGEVSERMIAAIKTFQTNHGGKPTGVLNPQERTTLAAAAKTLQDRAGWKVGLDPVNGIKLGLPTQLAPVQSAGATGSKWASANGQIQIETWRAKDTGLTIAAIAEREKQSDGRKVDYSVVKPDFFVLSGLQGSKKFYIRGQIKGSEVRGLTILYDQTTDGTMAPVVIAMSSAFAPFGGADNILTPAPPPRKKVEYSTGIVVSPDGAILADRNAVSGCDTIVIPRLGPAEWASDDSTRDLVLLRLYGASQLQPATFGSGPAKSDVTVTGIADPQNQGGADAATSVAARLVSNGGDVKLTPVPDVGFSGAAVTDADGRFAGLVLMKSPVIAGPALAPIPVQASLVPTDIIRSFLAGAKVNPATGAFDPKAAVVRVICVRK
jgi:peptidoglycan hydrolase-like protein with peptidoglycan-binding domain